MYTGLLSTPPTVATFDFVYNWYLVSGVVAGAFVIGLLLFFAFRYRARDGVPVQQTSRPESLWIVAAVILIMGSALFAAGFQTFAAGTNIAIPNAPNEVTIRVNAFQWGWNFTYPNGAHTLNNLTVPVDKIVVLNVTSNDVFHSFGIAMLAVKEDALPGKVNQLWFEMQTPGVYVNAIHCFELCGVGHAFMEGNLTAVSVSTWDTWSNSTRP